MSEPTVIMVEDDPNQAETFCLALRDYCRARRHPVPEIVTYLSEGGFLDALQQSREPATLYIFDLMLRWKEVGQVLTTQKPADYHSDLAGVRCKNAVRLRFPNAKVIVWTVVEAGHVPKEEFADCLFVKDKLDIRDVVSALRS